MSTNGTYTPWFIAGHQPDLFHPGVWLKNFVLYVLAKRYNGIAINLVVDNDTLKHRSIRVPIWKGSNMAPNEVHVATIPYDTGAQEIPLEDAVVQDEAVFGSFGARVMDLARHWPAAPIAAEFWRHAVLVESRFIGDRLAAARRVIEQQWGVRNLEVPMSALSKTQSFAAFAHSIFADAPRFQAAYNHRVAEFRARHHIRSHYHPVPDLTINGDHVELPIWAWEAGDPRRGRLFVKVDGEAIELRTDLGLIKRGTMNQMCDEWAKLQSVGLRIRPRALMTTMFARLALGDLFIHGIGGAIYDELTDSICGDYFGAPPPAFMVASGTLRLPLVLSAPPPSTCSRRDLTWKPQAFLGDNDRAHCLVEERNALIALRPATRQDRRDRFRALRDNLGRLAPFVATAIEEAKRLEANASAYRRATEILSARDFSFVLHTESELRRFFDQAAANVTS